jgi:hypothetical protein
VARGTSRRTLNSIKGINYEILKQVGYMKYYNKRAIVSGNVIEIIETEKPIFKGFTCRAIGRANAPNTTAEQKQENRSKIASRARSTVRRIANANSDILKKFLTLTFAENMTDIKKARYEFDKFIKRLKTQFNQLQYIVVLEFQKRGAIHFHLLCNLPYVDSNELAKIWGHGFIKINKIDNVDNIGAYVTKYMTKDSIDHRLVGKKCYSMSKGLKKPVELTDKDIIETFLAGVTDVKRVKSSEYISEYYGLTKYMQIVCSTYQTVLNACGSGSIPHQAELFGAGKVRLVACNSAGV